MLLRAGDWLFRNRQTGAITIAQMPNPSFGLFAFATALDWLLRPGGRFGLVLAVAARVCLAWWAADELLRGVNPWRRILGAGVLAYLCIAMLDVEG